MRAAWLLLAACGVSADSVKGSAADVTLADGDYGGYRLVRTCDNLQPASTALAVVGTGTKVLDDAAVRDWAADHVIKLVPHRQHAAYAANDGEPGCTTSLGIGVYSDDYTQVDDLARELGEAMRDDDVTVEVSVHVQPRDVPL